MAIDLRTTDEAERAIALLESKNALDGPALRRGVAAALKLLLYIVWKMDRSA